MCNNNNIISFNIYYIMMVIIYNLLLYYCCYYYTLIFAMNCKIIQNTFVCVCVKLLQSGLAARQHLRRFEEKMIG